MTARADSAGERLSVIAIGRDHVIVGRIIDITPVEIASCPM
jgi:hypothetical protein